MTFPANNWLWETNFHRCILQTLLSQREDSHSLNSGLRIKYGYCGTIHISLIWRLSPDSLFWRSQIVLLLMMSLSFPIRDKLFFWTNCTEGRVILSTCRISVGRFGLFWVGFLLLETVRVLRSKAYTFPGGQGKDTPRSILQLPLTPICLECIKHIWSWWLQKHIKKFCNDANTLLHIQSILRNPCFD